MTNQLFELFESGQMTTMTLPSHLAPLEEVQWFNRHYKDMTEVGEADCPTCKGKGDLPCSKCKGYGQVDCPYCDRERKAECYACNGKGCKNCEQTGKVTCQDCDTDGKIGCSKCDSDGWCRCQDCEEGKIPVYQLDGVRGTSYQLYETFRHYKNSNMSVKQLQ